MNVECPDGSVAARVQNGLLTRCATARPRDRASVEVPGSEGLTVTGNILALEYRIQRGGTTVSTVSRRWFRVRGTYAVEIARTEDHALLLAVAVVIDMMAHPSR